MESSDRERFGVMIERTLAYYGKTVSAESLSIWFNAMREFSIEEVRYALGAHVKDSERGRFAPHVADLIAKIPSGHLDPQEAWSEVARGISDERATLVMTDEMRKAFFAACDLGEDRIAARMCFIEVYRREIERARTEGLRPRWTVSLGFDKEGQEAPIAEAVSRGRISLAHACALLPHRAETLALSAPRYEVTQ